MHRCPIAVAGVALLVTGLSGATSAVAQWVPTRRFTVRDGLAQSQVTSLAQDKRGYVWVATQGGLSRWDGHRFATLTTVEGLPDDVVTALAADDAGGLWIGTDSGALAWWDGLRLRPERGPAETRTAVTGLAWTDGHLLVANALGLWCRGQRGFDRLLESPVAQLVRDPKNGAWAVANDVFRVEGTRVTRVAAPGGAGEAFAAIAPDVGGLWLATSAGSLLFREPTGKTRVAAKGLDRPRQLCADREGGVWVGGFLGLSHLSDRGDLTSHVLQPRLERTQISALLLDGELNLWVGSWGNGLFQRGSEAITVLTAETGLGSATVWTLLEAADGCVWMGSEDQGVEVWCGGAFGQRIGTAEGLPSNRVLTLARGDGDSVWIGTEQGLCRWSARERLRCWSTADGLPNSMIRSLARGRSGAMWIATSDGLARFSEGAFTVWRRSDGLPDGLIRSVTLDSDGLVWLATHNAGVVRFDGRRFESFDTGAGLPNNRVWCVTVDSRNRLWAGTDSGIWVHPIRDGADFTVGPSAGLPSPNVLFLVEDRLGTMWAGTTRGVARLSSAGHVERVFTVQDGMSDSEAAENAALCDGQGRLWFGMADGITCIDPTRLSANLVPPPLVLEQLFVNERPWGAPFPLASALAPADVQLRLAPGPADLRFEFVALSLTAPERVRYRAMLSGHDPAMSAPGEDRRVTYRRVPPGRYRFLFQACNNDGVWSELSPAVEITIPPPWYLATWFRLTVGALFALAVVGQIRVRLQRARRRQRELEKQVALRTAELGAANSRISEQNVLLAELSRTDPLTGLKNRRVLAEQLPLEMAVLRREVVREAVADLSSYHGLVVFMIDLDHFKSCNDLHGHEVGDLALQAVARAVEGSLREVDLAVRWGGEELVVLARGQDRKGAEVLARRLLTAVAAKGVPLAEGGELRLTASLGFVQYPLAVSRPLASEDWLLLVEIADRLMYLAKARGRARGYGLLAAVDGVAPASERELIAAALAAPAEPSAGLDLVEILSEPPASAASPR